MQWVFFYCLFCPLSPPDRFRQIEVFQQVTTAFSSLMGSSSSTLPPDALERRRRIGMFFRRALKKSRDQIHNNTTQDNTTQKRASTESLQPLQPPLEDKKDLLNVTKPGQPEATCLSQPAEEEGDERAPHAQHQMTSLKTQEGAHRPSRDVQHVTANTLVKVLEFESEMDEASQTTAATDDQGQHQHFDSRMGCLWKCYFCIARLQSPSSSLIKGFRCAW